METKAQLQMVRGNNEIRNEKEGQCFVPVCCLHLV